MKKISIIIPFFNEDEGVQHFFAELNAELIKIKEYSFELVLVDDGSVDQTLRCLKNLDIGELMDASIIELSRNFGKEAALTAGIHHFTGDAAIFMDSDLEHPPKTIKSMLDKWEEGYDVILGKRMSRENETILKRFGFNIFYWIYNKISQFKNYPGVGEFRLMNRASVDALRQLDENQRFMRGLMSWVGFKEAIVEFEPVTRKRGQSKFSYFKLLSYGLNGITSFSIAPLRLSIFLGIFSATGAVLYSLYLLWEFIIYGVDVSGFPTLLLTTVFFGSINLIVLGIIGDYIGKIFLESKRRPSFVVREIYKLK
jgi:glycosyltransferase involved in cell wall biosynthesis|tara:strand:+ start:4597 stop:5532 length:936 start_codon:yes stop_codon:yes gene_type:complete